MLLSYYIWKLHNNIVHNLFMLKYFLNNLDYWYLVCDDLSILQKS